MALILVVLLGSSAPDICTLSVPDYRRYLHLVSTVDQTRLRSSSTSITASIVAASNINAFTITTTASTSDWDYLGGDKPTARTHSVYREPRNEGTSPHNNPWFHSTLSYERVIRILCVWNQPVCSLAAMGYVLMPAVDRFQSDRDEEVLGPDHCHGNLHLNRNHYVLEFWLLQSGLILFDHVMKKMEVFYMPTITF